jgi:kumamolisin
MSGVPNPGITPSLVATAYEISPLHDAGFLGDGLNIAIVSFDTFTPEDVPVFDAQMGITGAPQVQKVTLPGGPDTPGSGTGEVALDIQVIRGIAPHAQITSYEGPNTSDGLVPIISRIVADGKAKIVSSSWGTCENRNSRSAMQAEQQELAAAVAAGISYFSSSGDDAAYDCRRVHVSDNAMERDITPGVDWPAASANVIAVGGTFLTTREDGSYYEEAGWEEPLGGSGSGGGLSRFQQRPSWQQGAGVDNAQTNGMRQGRLLEAFFTQLFESAAEREDSAMRGLLANAIDLEVAHHHVAFAIEAEINERIGQEHFDSIEHVCVMLAVGHH